MTDSDKIKIQKQLNIYDYDNLSIDQVYNQIKRLIRKAVYKDVDVFCNIKATKYNSFGIRVHVLNSRKFEVA